HEKMAFWNRVHRRRIRKTRLVHAVQRLVTHSVGQRFAPPLDAIDHRTRRLADEIGKLSTLYGLAIDMQQSIDDLNLVARKSDDPLYVVDGVISRQPEDDNIAALRLRTHDPADKRRRIEERQ